MPELILPSILGETEPSDDAIRYSGADGTILSVSLQELAYLLQWLRRDAGIPPKNKLFIRNPSSGQFVLVPLKPEPGRSPPAAPTGFPVLRYRLECRASGAIVQIDVHEEQSEAHLSDATDISKRGRSLGERITEMLAKPPSCDYPQLFADLTDVMQSVQNEIALRLTPALKAKMQSMPHETYAQKQELSKWVNAALRQFGLAIRWNVRKKTEHGFEQRTYQAALGTHPGNHPAQGRFQVRYRDEDGKECRPLNTPSLSVLLDRFDVVVDDPQRHTTGKWTERARHGQQRER